MADRSAVGALILETRNLSKNFGGLGATRSVSLALHRNELHAVIGPNGAGKSTLVNLLAGELLPSEGCVLLEGTDITPLNVWRRTRVGVAPVSVIRKAYGDSLNGHFSNHVDPSRTWTDCPWYPPTSTGVGAVTSRPGWLVRKSMKSWTAVPAPAFLAAAHVAFCSAMASCDMTSISGNGAVPVSSKR